MTPEEICNQSLNIIGQGSITSLDEEVDETHNANVCRLFFFSELDACLREHVWNFSLKRKVLAESVDTPLSSVFTRAFTRDPDDLRVISINDDPDASYQVEGRLIITDLSSVTVRYVSRVSNPTEWDSLFTSAYCLRLASKLALAIAHDTAMAARLYEQFRLEITTAQTVDGQESEEPPYQSLDLIRVRSS